MISGRKRVTVGSTAATSFSGPTSGCTGQAAPLTAARGAAGLLLMDSSYRPHWQAVHNPLEQAMDKSNLTIRLTQTCTIGLHAVHGVFPQPARRRGGANWRHQIPRTAPKRVLPYRSDRTAGTRVRRRGAGPVRRVLDTVVTRGSKDGFEAWPLTFWITFTTVFSRKIALEQMVRPSVASPI